MVNLNLLQIQMQDLLTLSILSDTMKSEYLTPIPLIRISAGVLKNYNVVMSSIGLWVKNIEGRLAFCFFLNCINSYQHKTLIEIKNLTIFHSYSFNDFFRSFLRN